MNNDLLDHLALKTGGSHFPAVFHHYQRDYVLHVLSEIYKVYQKNEDLEDMPEHYIAVDLWEDIVRHFQLDNYETEKITDNNA